MEINELAAALVKQVKSAAEEYSRLKGFSLNSLQGLIATTRMVVKEVEETGLAHGLKGADKKALAIEVLLQVVKLPWWMPAALIRAILPPLIDAIVEALKDKFGK